jgi:hypothetical protein
MFDKDDFRGDLFTGQGEYSIKAAEYARKRGIAGCQLPG